MRNLRIDSAAGKAMHALGPRGSAALFAASAVAAVAWRELEHRRVTGADLPDAGIKVETLWDIRHDQRRLKQIEEALTEEWGEFGLLGFDTVERMANIAGRTTLIASERQDGGYLARAALQTTLIDAGGDPARLAEAYPHFRDLVQPRAWLRAAKNKGDTAVLLQITTFGSSERGAGLGSLLRNTALHMQGRHVRYALTTTPIDADTASLDLANPKTYTAAMKFHARGGAEPTSVLPGYKSSSDARNRHGQDVVVMRYARDDQGGWPAPKPEMRVHSVGPLQEGVSTTARRLAKVPVRGKVAIVSLRRRAAVPKRIFRLPKLHGRAS